MIKLKHITTLCLFILLSNLLMAQEIAIQQKQKAVINKFIEGYNQQNYSKMKKQFFFIAKFLPLKKLLKQGFEPRFNKYGKAILTNIKHPKKDQIITELTYEKDTTQKDFLNTYFNKKNKIVGLGFQNPDFVYPKTNNTNEFSEKEKSLKIDSVVNKKYLTDNFNGCVLVIDNGNVIYKKSYGYANYENKILLNDSSVFELASCSKQFTAMAIMILMEQGKLKFTDTLQKYIPELPYKNITIENLLTHTSGLPDYMQLLENRFDKKKFATNYDIMELFKKHKPKPNYLPNEVFDYSNTGYALLSVIIEKVSGITYSEFLYKNIFEPLNMKNTRVYNTRRSKGEKINNYAYGYVYSEKLKKYLLPDSLSDYNYVKYMDAITGDGTVNTTISDLVLWEDALRKNKLIAKKILEKAYSSYKLPNGKKTNYGYAEFINEESENEKLVYHSGGWPGYRTFILRFLDQQKSIIILSNNEYENFMKLADKIALILIDKKQ